MDEKRIIEVSKLSKFKFSMKIPWKKALSIYATAGIPLVYLYTLYITYFSHNTLSLSPLIIVFGFSIGLFGVSIWLLSYYYLGFSFGVLPQKQKRVTKGLYKYFSHPMYAGIWCTFVGLSLANNSLPGLLFTTLIITPLLFIRAAFEDKVLHD